MAQPIVKEKSKDHRRRKNPGARDAFAKERHEKNAKRPKQVWVPEGWTTTENGPFYTPGHWAGRD